MMSKSAWLDSPVGGVLLDISGVLRDGDTAIDGSVDAFKKLKSSPIPVRLVTNETQVTVQSSVDKLLSLGFANITHKDITAPAPALVQLLKKEGLRPHLLVHPGLLPEFSELDQSDPNCVVVGDAAEHFTYEAMNKTFQILLKLKDSNPKFFTLGKGRYYKDDGELCLDVGPFATALEYATDITAEVVGKPSSLFFQLALNEMGVSPKDVIMVGDDIIGDVGGAQKTGMRGVLVRTGKFRPSDENHPQVTPDAIVNNLAEAVDLILGILG